MKVTRWIFIETFIIDPSLFPTRKEEKGGREKKSVEKLVKVSSQA